ncbi:MAG: hypothetical protein V8R17_12200 [Blautia obeum]
MSNNTATIKTRKNLVSTGTITMTALLAAISYVLAFLEFPVPFGRLRRRKLHFCQHPGDLVTQFPELPYYIQIQKD